MTSGTSTVSMGVGSVSQQQSQRQQQKQQQRKQDSSSSSTFGTIRYTCLPHSSLSQTSHVALAVRSLHCSPPPLCGNLYDLYARKGKQREGTRDKSEEKKDDYHVGNYTSKEEYEFHVTATVYTLGGALPLHSDSCSTRSSPLVVGLSASFPFSPGQTRLKNPKDGNHFGPSNQNITMGQEAGSDVIISELTTTVQQRQKTHPVLQQVESFGSQEDEVIEYNNVMNSNQARVGRMFEQRQSKNMDASTTNNGIKITRPTVSTSSTTEHSYCIFNDVLHLPVRWKDLTRDAVIAINVVGPGGRQMWGTVLPLFDQHGRLHSGLQKLLLHPGMEADCGLKYDSDDGLFNPGGVTPGFIYDDTEKRASKSGPAWFISSEEDHDEKWKASLILDALERSEEANSLLGPDGRGGASAESAGGEGGAGDGNATASGGGDIAPSSQNLVQSVPWLDKLTKERCHQILSEPSDGDGRQVKCSTLPRSWPEPPPSFLIVELPVFPIPIVHEETFYPHSVHGASGSVTALELSMHHKRLAKELGHKDKKASLSIQLSPITPDDNDMGLSLVQFLDFENEDDNPVEDKYRTLAHDLIRGLVDPALKPDREQRARLASIIASPSHHLTTEEKDLLWRFRFSLVDNRRALTKFLLAVDWTVESEVVQAAELLEQWRKRSPIEVTDALKLLGKHVAFQTNLVRAYAIDTLAAAPDAELRLYLLQLVQALKYENASDAEISPNLESPNTFVSASTSGAVASLASFLIDRASKNLDLANYLYWYLKVELQDPTHGSKYCEVFSAFREKLSKSPSVYNVSDVAHARSPSGKCKNDSVSRESHDQKSVSEDHKQAAFTTIIGSMSKLGSSLLGGDNDSHTVGSDDGGKQKRRCKTPTMWDVLVAQDLFISGIMDCQMKSREFRGKKDAKEACLRELLASQGLEHVKDQKSVPLPSAPHIMVKGANPQSARMFKSALYPAVIEFTVDKSASRVPRMDTDTGIIGTRWGASSSSLPVHAENSHHSSQHESSSTYKVIVKTGDDLRQDQLVIMMIKLMDGLLKRGTLDLCLKPYSIIATSQSSGLVEFVVGSMPISQILANHNNSILQFFRTVAPLNTAKYGIQPDVMQTYIRSCAGYCVITYILGVGDRHLDNIMLLPSGHFFHIDFGFIFGRDPKPLPPAFRLTREMVDGMGGVESPEYQHFCSLACQAYNLLRKSAGLVLNLLHLMSDAGIEDLSNNPSADAEGVISKVEERLRLELTDEQAENFFLGLINDSLVALAPRVMDVFHQLATARR